MKKVLLIILVILGFYCNSISQYLGINNSVLSINNSAVTFNKDALRYRIPQKQLIKIALFGDSIFGSGISDIDSSDTQQPFTLAWENSIGRKLQDELVDMGYKIPLYKKWNHADISITGSYNKVISAYPSYYAYVTENYAELNDESGNEVAIEVTGHTNVDLIFEGGEATQNPTGLVYIQLSTNGGAYQTLSSDIGAKDTKYTHVGDFFSNSKHCNDIEVKIVDLNPANTYSFKIIRPSYEENVRFWGIRYYSGINNICVMNQSIAGLSWDYLTECVYNGLELIEPDMVIVQAPMYHDFLGLGQVSTDANELITRIKQVTDNVILCSCPPGGIASRGSTEIILGDENSSAYPAGLNFTYEFNRWHYFFTSSLSAENRPEWNDVYRINISGQDYDIKNTDPASESATTLLRFIISDTVPISNASYPLTFTKVSGDGTASFQATAKRLHFTMNQHRDTVQAVALLQNIPFIDLYRRFEIHSNRQGETLEIEGYLMPTDHPRYDYCHTVVENPVMNYMTNFFDVGDGHHLSPPANDIIIETIIREF